MLRPYSLLKNHRQSQQHLSFFLFLVEDLLTVESSLVSFIANTSIILLARRILSSSMCLTKLVTLSDASLKPLILGKSRFCSLGILVCKDCILYTDLATLNEAALCQWSKLFVNSITLFWSDKLPNLFKCRPLLFK